VVPAFGEPPFLKQTLQSIVSTQDESVKIIVLDDCSTSPFIHEISAEFSPRITYARNPSNLGVSENFNQAFRMAKSEYVQVIGHDDVLTASMLSVLQRHRDEMDDCFGIQPYVDSIDESGRIIRDPSFLSKRFLTPKRNGIVRGKRLTVSLMIGNWTYFPSIIWRVEKLPPSPFSSDYKYCMDLDLLLRLGSTGLGLLVLDEKGFQYRRHRNSVSMAVDPRERFKEERAVLTENSVSSKNRYSLERTLSKVALLPRMNLVLSQFNRMIGNR
jgi:glycosyltransferase involved in cell wall biosynthesis